MRIDDPFLKNVHPDLKARKTGMRILIFSDLNIAGQLSLLATAINNCTIHAARLVVIHGDYLDYDRDIILQPSGLGPDSSMDPAAVEEAVALINAADFYHIGRGGVLNIEGVDWNKLIRPNNAVVQFFGSEIRNNGKQMYEFYRSRGMVGLSFWDYTMLREAPFFYHVDLMADASRVVECKPLGDSEPIVFCHAPTNRAFKKTDLFLEVANRMIAKSAPIEVRLIEKVSNAECLAIKSQCHATYDQISVGIYALNAIESMIAGHAVLCGMSNFATSYAPDNPVVYVTEATLEAQIRYLVWNRQEVRHRGLVSRPWALVRHSPVRIVRQYVNLYDFVVNGHRLIEERDGFMLPEELIRGPDARKWSKKGTWGADAVYDRKG